MLGTCFQILKLPKKSAYYFLKISSGDQKFMCEQNSVHLIKLKPLSCGGQRHADGRTEVNVFF